MKASEMIFSQQRANSPSPPTSPVHEKLEELLELLEARRNNGEENLKKIDQCLKEISLFDFSKINEDLPVSNFLALMQLQEDPPLKTLTRALDTSKKIKETLKSFSNYSLSNSSGTFFYSNCLNHAAELGCFSLLKAFIQAGADLDQKDRNRDTPLHYAAMGENTAIIQWLLDQGLSINAQNFDGKTPLHQAAATGNEIAMEYLLKQGAQVDSQTMWGGTPLYETIDYTSKSHGQAFEKGLRAMRLLMLNGAEIEPVLRKRQLSPALKNLLETWRNEYLAKNHERRSFNSPSGF